MKLRLPEALKEQIETAAKANGRSMNSEIVARLEQSMKSSTTAALEEFLRNDDFAQAFADRVEQNLTMRGLSIVPTAALPKRGEPSNG